MCITVQNNRYEPGPLATVVAKTNRTCVYFPFSAFLLYFPYALSAPLLAIFRLAAAAHACIEKVTKKNTQTGLSFKWKLKMLSMTCEQIENATWTLQCRTSSVLIWWRLMGRVVPVLITKMDAVPPSTRCECYRIYSNQHTARLGKDTHASAPNQIMMSSTKAPVYWHSRTLWRSRWWSGGLEAEIEDHINHNWHDVWLAFALGVPCPYTFMSVCVRPLLANTHWRVLTQRENLTN